VAKPGKIQGVHQKRISPAGNNVNIKPEYGDLDIKLYSNFGEIGAYRFWWKKNTVASTILSNRGCRARCSFCSVRSFNGKGVRGRSLKSVVDELQFLKEYHGVNHVMWLDDDLLFDRERTIGMFNEIVKRNLNITWDASNGIIASALKDEVLDAAATSGCIGMHFGTFLLTTEPIDNPSKRIKEILTREIEIRGEFIIPEHGKIYDL